MKGELNRAGLSTLGKTGLREKQVIEVQEDYECYGKGRRWKAIVHCLPKYGNWGYLLKR